MLTSNHKSIQEAKDSLIKQGYIEDEGVWHNQATYSENKDQYTIAFITCNANMDHFVVIYTDNLTMNY